MYTIHCTIYYTRNRIPTLTLSPYLHVLEYYPQYPSLPYTATRMLPLILFFCIQALEHVRLPLITAKFIVGTISKEPVLMSIAECRDLVDEAKNYLLLPQVIQQL